MSGMNTPAIVESDRAAQRQVESALAIVIRVEPGTDILIATQSVEKRSDGRRETHRQIRSDCDKQLATLTAEYCRHPRNVVQ